MEDDEYKKLPAEDRCVHKLWKARVDGYEELTKLFRQIDDEKSPEFSKYLGLVKKFVTDSNAMGQEKGLEATLAYIENYANAGKTVQEVMSGIVLKCMAAPKTRTKELALQVTLMYFEIEKQDATLEELIKGMDQKNPKIVIACINACTTALREFGSKIVNVKPLMKKIGPLFADRDKGVRDEARMMVVEMYRWVGAALRPQLGGLQPVQVTELEAEFAKINGQKVVPLRYVRSQQKKQVIIDAAAEEVDAGASDEGEDEGEAPPIDPYELAVPVDILSKLPKDFYEKIEAKKWQDRKEALENVENLLKAPKLENGDYGDLVRALKKVVQKDSNVVVVALAGRCIAALAAGLKKRFQTYSGACVSALLEKFKEKKQNVVSAIKDAIDNVYLTTNIEAVLDDVIEALGNKNPSVKAETAMFLTRAFTKTNPAAVNKKTLKAITAPLLKNVNEPDPTVRDCSAEAVGTLMKLVGEKAIGPFLVELEKDNLKMAKIKECCEKAVITVKPVGVKIVRPTTAPVKAAVVKSKSSASVPKSAPSKPGAAAKKKPEISSGSATVVRGKSKTVKAVKPIEKELNDEEVDEMVADILNITLIGELSDSNWKTRLAAAEQFLSRVQSLESKDIPAQALVRTLTKKPGLKDTNFQVLKVKLDVVKFMAENAKFSTTTANCCVTDIAEKFGDAKNGSQVSETMTAIAEATGLPYISATLIEFALVQKSPKVAQEVLLWLSNSIKDFGLANLNINLVIENIKKALASTNPGVRQAAISLSGILFLYMGPNIHAFFETEKPALRELITVEFNKYEGQKPPLPTKGVVKSASSNNILDAFDEESAGERESPPNLQDLMPRIDISSQITEALINEIEDKNWKVRNEGLTKVNAILEEAKHIKPNIGDLPQALAHRLTDSNTKIAQFTLNICEAIVKAMGPPCKQYIKVLFPGFLQSLGDSKSWMRTTALDTINAFADQCGCKEFFENEMIGDALKTGSPTLRIELWGWLAEKLPKIPLKSIPKEEITICIPHLYSNLEDRNADVRKNAQEAILGIMIHVGYESMAKQTEKLKHGSKNVISAALEKVRPNLPAKPLPKKQAAPEKEEKVIKGTKPVTTSKNAVKPKGSAGSGKGAPVSGRKKEEDVDTSPLLVVNNMKHQRTIDESKLKVLKWNFTTPREEFVELLKDQMTAANVNKTLIFNMFHTDFRYHIKAIESLMEDLPDNEKALMSNLDLILKWLTLRFFDTNPSVLLKGLDYLQSVFSMLKDAKYHMLESEASSFLPYLVLKIGDPKDSVRNGVRSLFKQILYVYSVSRMFTYIMEGVKSKNARQRAECLELMGILIEEIGMTVFSPSPAICLKEIAKQISDRDNSVRNAALNCIVEAYYNVGEKIYKMVGNISDKDLSLLEERIKRCKKVVVPKPVAVPSPPSTSKKHPELPVINGDGDVPNENREDSNEEEEEELPPVLMPPTIVQPVNEVTGPYRLDPELIKELDTAFEREVSLLPPVQEFDLEFLKTEVKMPSFSETEFKARVMPLSPPKPLDPNVSISRLNLNMHMPTAARSHSHIPTKSIGQITSSHSDTVLQGVTDLTRYLKSSRSDIVGHEDDIISAITTQLKKLRNSDPTTDEKAATIYRSLLTLIDAFFHKDMGHHASIDVLKDFMNELIALLVGRKLENAPTGDCYIRAINLECAKVIEKSDHTRILCALVQLMQECVRSDLSSRQTDLVMKCLWRVIKSMPDWAVDSVDYDMVLLYVHNFLKEFPSCWWKTKPTDTTIRTIKTILHSSVKIKGGSIMLHLGKISNTSESEVESYILKLLKSLKIEEVKQVPLKPETQRLPLSRATHNMLTDIFQKIGSKDETKEGLNLLYDFMQQHPEADIDPFLKKSSKFFQDYIEKGLREIKESRKSKQSTIEKVEQKVVETISMGSEVELKGPEYWEERLKMWQKVWDNPEFVEADQYY